MNAKIIPFPGCEDVLAKSKPKQKEVYYGNPRSRKYHAPGCRYFKNMKDAVIFKSKEEARAARFLPCGLCYPSRGQFKQEMEAFKKKLAERLRRQQGKVVTQQLIVRKESGFWRIRTDKGELSTSEKDKLIQYFKETGMPYEYSNGELLLPGKITWEEIEKRLSVYYGDRAEIFPF